MNKFYLKPVLLILLCTMKVALSQTVAVDIGHHLKDPGATSAYGNTEYSYNKRMADAVINKLQDYGNQVNIINYSGETVSLTQRTALAKGSDFFIAIHHDSVQEVDLSKWEYEGQTQHYNDKEHGFSVFVSRKNPYFQQSLICAREVSRDLVKAGFSPNYYHATHPKNKPRVLFNPNEPVYQYDNLVVLKTATMPAILVEAGVIVNRNEAIWITNEVVREKFAIAVASGITQCMSGKK